MESPRSAPATPLRRRTLGAISGATITLVVAATLSAVPAAAALAPADDGAWRFDFGTPTSPVADGHQQVTMASLYTAETGWGITVADGVTLFDRDRTGNRTPADPVAEDFVAGLDWGFQLDDVPTAEYDVTITIGDALTGTSGTNATVTLEGTAQTRLTTSGGGTTTETFRTAVEDGQLTVGFTGSGLGAYLNGLVVTPVVPAVPAGFALTGIAWNAVDLSWSASDGASAYRVLRGPVTAETVGDLQQIAEIDTTSFSDTAVAEGDSFAYAVEAVNSYGLVSARTATVLSGPIPALTAPTAPADLAVAEVTNDAVSLTWAPTPNAEEYVVERAGADGVFAELATVTAPAHTDPVDTTQEWSYRVIARNAAGTSAASEPVTSAVYVAPVPLPEGDRVVFDFGPGALAEGAIAVTSTTSFSDEWGYGFSTAPASTEADVDRGGDDPLRSDYVAAQGGTFEVQLGAGDYTVALIAGDSAASSEISITAESIAKVQTTAKPAGEHLEMVFPIALIDGRLTLQIGGSAAALDALTITRQAPRLEGALPTVYIAGDSTVQTYADVFAPQAGWGQMIDRFFAGDIAFANHAIGGRSSKNFITQGRLDEILRGIRPGDYLFVQFGHNDATQGVDDRYASPADYKEYLRSYVQGARQRGATPVLVTPVSRRSFDAETGEFNVSFPDYVAKMTELAHEEAVDLVDLSASSRAYLNEIGPEAAKSVFLWVDPGIFPNRPSGTQDDTHFQEYGAIQMARLIAQDVAELDDPLAAKVTDIEPPASVPAAPADLVAGSISNAGALLKWSASATADIYRIERQAVADPDETWSLVTTTTQTSAVVQGLAEGTGYRYRVFAVNGRGTSAASNVVTFFTKQAKWKFDFQLSGNVLMTGYTEVNPDDAYDAETGFGFQTPLASNAGRDRGTAGGANDIERDFVLPGDSSTFVLDVPNGTYSVKTYSGDWIGTTRTNFDIEGRSFGSGNAGAGSVNASVRGPVLVTDGQLTVRVHGSAAGTRLNGLEITPILLGPAGLSATEVNADPAAPTVTLGWTDEPDLTWKVYRTSAFEKAATLLGETPTASFTDTTARLGLDYAYHVTAVDQTGLESVPSASVDVSLVDPDVTVPSAPTGVAVDHLDKREIALSWAQPSTAEYAMVFRSEIAGERGVLAGFTATNRFADTDVLTTIPYHYTVVAVNAGGVGPGSEQLITDATTVLQRQAEFLDRAPAAVETGDGVLISWRMLGTDPDAIGFHVYRDGERITGEPITDSTNLLDADGDTGSKYFVTRVLEGVEVTVTDEFAVQSGDHLSVPLDKPADAYTKDGQPYSYRANDASVGDVDGDGQYELLVKWDPTNSQDNSRSGYTGNVYLDAYRLDGTRLWRIDLGVNIRAGAHYTQFQVFDYDGDGRAEVMMKTADGTIDGVGQPIGSASADWRSSAGYVLTGPEYLTVFDGETGAAIDTVDYVPARGDVGAWGDTYGNRVDRFLAATAYLDGERPSAVFSRGYYTRAVLAAYDFDGENLVQRWVIDSNDTESAALYGMGNHNLSVADVDGDQKDEIVFGSATVDDDGTLLYSTGLGHGDAIHLSDLVPSNPGLEVFAAHEDMNRSGNVGATMRDARTGDVLWSIPAARDTGRAASADIDPRYEGAEGWAVGGDAAWNSREGYLMSASGERIGSSIPAANFLAWFDGDPLREIVDHDWTEATRTGVPTVSKWNPQTGSAEPVLTANGALSNNDTKGTPNLQADLFGDWREEIAWRSEDSTELRIYSTTDPTEIRLRTLMHDPVYRLSVAWQNTGYNQPPQTSFFLGDGMEQPPAPRIAVTGDPTGAADTTAPVISGLPDDGMLLASSASYTVAVTADDPESGVRNLDIAFDGEPVAPGQTIDLDDLVGPHTLTVNAVNHDGLSARTAVQLLVYEDEGAKKAPARGVLSTDSGWEDGLHDGEYTVSMNLWHGVNGAVFLLYENGELISTELLDADSPNAQVTTVRVSGKENGTYVYTGELINANGTTQTTSVRVKVTDAAPAAPVISHDNHDKDGEYTISTDLWWGTNATGYRLFENGVVIDEQTLVADSPNAQHVQTPISGRTAGEYVYVAEFSNAAGSTTSQRITVTVR